LSDLPAAAEGSPNPALVWRRGLQEVLQWIREQAPTRLDYRLGFGLLRLHPAASDPAARTHPSHPGLRARGDSSIPSTDRCLRAVLKLRIPPEGWLRGLFAGQMALWSSGDRCCNSRADRFRQKLEAQSAFAHSIGRGHHGIPAHSRAALGRPVDWDDCRLAKV